MDNNKSRGIFLGVLSVATLIVSIIGATFAYFVASANGKENAVQAGTANVAGTLTLTETVDYRQNMIPVTEKHHIKEQRQQQELELEDVKVTLQPVVIQYITYVVYINLQ